MEGVIEAKKMCERLSWTFVRLAGEDGHLVYRRPGALSPAVMPPSEWRRLAELVDGLKCEGGRDGIS